MSRIGKVPVPVPAGVKVAVSDSTVAVEGPKGKLEQSFPSQVTVQVDEAAKQVVVNRHGETRQHKAMHGLVRALIRNMVVGVSAVTKRNWRSSGSATWRPCRRTFCNCGWAMPMSFKFLSQAT